MAVSLKDAIKTNGGESQLFFTLKSNFADNIDRAARGGFTQEVHDWFNAQSGKTIEQAISAANSESRAVAAANPQPTTPQGAVINPTNDAAQLAYNQRLASMQATPANTGVPPLGTPEYTNYLVQKGNALGMSLDQYQVPTKASQVTPGVVTQTPSPNVSFGNISNAMAGAAGMNTQLDIAKQERDDFTKKYLDQQEESKNWLKDFLSSSKSPTEIRAEEEMRLGMESSKFFADQKAKVAEIENLTQQYNALVAAKDQQIAMSYDKLASTNFINNQIAQINRNAAPELNRLSANINSKAATMEALQGNFDRAQDYINQAVQDATTEKREKLQAFELFQQMNQQTFNALSPIYQDAYNKAFEIAKLDYQNDLEMKKTLANLQLENPQVAIDLNGTLDQAVSAIRSNPKANKGEIFGTSETGYFERYYDAVSNTYKTKSLGGSSVSTGLGGGQTVPISGGKTITLPNNPYADVMLETLQAGGTPEQAAREAAAVSEGIGVQVDQKTLTKWIADARTIQTSMSNAKSSVPKNNGAFNTPAQGPQFVAQMQAQQQMQPRFTGSNFQYDLARMKNTVGGFFNSLFGR